MNNSKNLLKKELDQLCLDGRFLFCYILAFEEKLDDEAKKKLKNDREYQGFAIKVKSFKSNYHKWYSKALQVVKQLIPDRYDEFKSLYHVERRNNKEITWLTYYISDYLLGLSIKKGWDTAAVDGVSACISKFEQQIEILGSCIDFIDSKLMNIEGVLQSDLYENELHTAKDILKKKHIRVAGTLAGITLEGHLKSVCKTHNINLRKANPTISDFNEELKKNEFIDLPTWRLIQRLGDIRNLSVHSKDREPTTDEVEDLIRGCEKLIAELN